MMLKWNMNSGGVETTKRKVDFSKSNELLLFSQLLYPFSDLYLALHK